MLRTIYGGEPIAIVWFVGVRCELLVKRRDGIICRQTYMLDEFENDSNIEAQLRSLPRTSN